MKRQLMVTAIAITLLGAGLVGAGVTFAQGNQDSPTLVQKIADKFKLNKDEVQSVFDQHRDERHAKVQAKYEERLNQLVKDGKITEAQKQLILKKHAEMKAKMESSWESRENTTPEERKAKMTATKEELQKWADENGIDLKYLMPFGKGMRGMHFFNKAQ